MAEDTVVSEPTGFTPEPVPDTIADTELNGFNPTDESTDTSEVEAVKEETDDDQQADKLAEEPEDEPEQEEQPEAVQPKEVPKEQVEDRKELPAEQAYKQRQENRAQRDYVTEQRQKIREYEQTVNQDDVNERMRVLEAKQYVDTVERNRTQIVTENTRAQADIPLFNPNDKAFQPTLYQRAIERFNDSYVVPDPETGEVLGAQDRNGNNVSLYNYLQQEAASIAEVLGANQRQAQRSESKMRSKAVNPSNPGKVTSSGDDLQDLLDRIGDTPLI